MGPPPFWQRSGVVETNGTAGVRHRGPRAVLGFTVLTGLVTVVSMTLTRPDMVNANFSVYHRAAEVALAGGDFYAVAPSGFPTLTYLYPPATVLAFAPFTPLTPLTGYLVHSLLSIGACLALAWACTSYLAERGIDLSRLDLGLIGSACLLSPFVVPTLVFGNVNMLLAASIGLGLLAIERDRPGHGGALIGAVASIKVFPALVGVWLARDRAWRALLTAAAVGVATLLLGVLAFGLEVTQYYLSEVLLGQGAQPGAVTDPARGFVTLHRPISRLLDIAGLELIGISAVVLAPVVGYGYMAIETARDRLIAAFVTLVATLLVLPSTFTYVPYAYFPFIPLLYLLEGRARSLFAIGALVTHVPITLREGVLLRAVVPPALLEPLQRSLEAVLSIGTFPLFGLLVCLAACLIAKSERMDR